MDSSPIVARPGQKVILRYRILGNVDEGRIIRPDKSTVSLKDEGNGVFSTEVIAPAPGVRDAFSPYLGEVRGYSGPDQKCFNNALINVITSEIPPARVSRLASDAQYSDFVVNLAVPSSQLPSLNALTFSFEPAPIVQRFYQLYGDDYDMLNIIIAPGYYENRYHIVVKNNVQGIGTPLMDVSARYGSKGRLMGLNVFPLFFFFDGADRGAVHEIGHQWAAHWARPPFIVPPHWPVSSMASGIMGFSHATATQGLEFPCRIRKSGNDVVTSPGLQSQFSDLDLYLMGLMTPAEVGDNYIITDPDLEANLPNQCGTRTLQPNQYSTIRLPAIVSDYGARVPAATGKPGSLRIANILVTRETLADADTMSLADFYARRFQDRIAPPVKVGLARRLGAPFYVATDKRATVTTQLTSTALPEISAGGIVNGATFSGDRVAPGTVLSLFGSNLAATTAQAQSTPLPGTLGGAQVLVNGKPAPLFYVSPNQINFQLPWEMNVTNEAYPDEPFATFIPSYTVHVRNAELTSNLAYIYGQPDVPVVMVYGDNLPVAQDSQYRVIGPANPARPGDTIVVYYLGARQFRSAPPATGEVAPLDRYIQVLGSTAFIGAQAANVAFAGLTPGGVGLQQINIRVPNLAPGTYDLKLTINNVPTNTTRLVVGQ